MSITRIATTLGADVREVRLAPWYNSSALFHQAHSKHPIYEREMMSSNNSTASTLVRWLVVIAALFAIATCAVTLRSLHHNHLRTTVGGGQTHGIQPEWMDTTADPGQDFNLYANAGWMEANPIPAEYARWGTFNVLRDNTLKTLHKILTKVAQNKTNAPGSNEQKIGDFWYTGMNEAQIEADGAKPLAPELAKIAAIANNQDLAAEVAHLHLIGIDVLFGLSSGANFANSSQVIAHAGQRGLGLPNRDFYLHTDAKSAELREKYVALIEHMFTLLGDSAADAKVNAKAVMDIEMGLAKASMGPADMRDPDNIDHMMSQAKFQELFPDFQLTAYLTATGAPKFSELNVMQPEFFKAVNSLLKTVDMPRWKNYLRWHLVSGTAAYLSSDFVNAQFDFYGKTLSGSKQLQPRWKRVIEHTNSALGEAVGQLYVKEAFPPEAKAKVLNLIENLKAELKERLQTLSWMSNDTRKNALIKLAAFEAKIGYPDKWRDYSQLTIARDSYLANVLRAREFAAHFDLDKIGKPMDRSEWSMTPQTVNAYYSPDTNQIVFPAAILQPPFFDPQADDAANYGGIGVVIGHEMTHGFDDQGSKFDAQGNLKDWWTEADKAAFDERVSRIVDEFDGFWVGEVDKATGKPKDPTYLQGKLVAGEAAADLGGVKLAYGALQKILAGKPRVPHATKFTDEQRFFIAFAQVWAGQSRLPAERTQVMTDPHPPGRFRVNGTLANLPEFARAFGLKPPCPMILPPNKRCDLW